MFPFTRGRDVDMYAKIKIDADINDLDMFTITSEFKPRVSIYNKQLKLDIDMELDAIGEARNHA